MNSALTIRLLSSSKDLDEISLLWKNLSTNAEHSFFLSWQWIGTWLESLPFEVSVVVIEETEKGISTPVAMFGLGVKKGVEKKIIWANRSYLNATGDDQIDNLTIEYNGLLVSTENQNKLTNLFDNSAFDHIQEFNFPDLAADQSALVIDTSSNEFNHSRSSTASYFVDLVKLQSNENDLMPLLGASTRSNIRRSLSLYEKEGFVALKRAESAAECVEMLDELASLHNKEWRKRGKAGAFEDEYFLNFHKSLIKKCFEKGEVELLQVKTPESTIGYLYNFIYKNSVLFYQSGFNYESNSKLKPGYVCHYLACCDYAKRGLLEYDFLKGDSQYKRSLSTDKREMHTIKFQRKLARFQLENKIRDFKNRIR